MGGCCTACPKSGRISDAKALLAINGGGGGDDLEKCQGIEGAWEQL